MYVGPEGAVAKVLVTGPFEAGLGKAGKRRGFCNLGIVAMGILSNTVLQAV